MEDCVDLVAWNWSILANEQYLSDNVCIIEAYACLHDLIVPDTHNWLNLYLERSALIFKNVRR